MRTFSNRTTKLDIFDEKSGHFPVVSSKKNIYVFYKTLRHFLVIFEATQQDIFYKTSETHPVSFTGERRLVFSLLSLHY